MQFGMVGLGRMGANMALRLMSGGHHCVAYDRDPDKVTAMVGRGASAQGQSTISRTTCNRRVSSG